MKATQGVILIMIAALLLYLTWSARSALRNTGSTSGGRGGTQGSTAVPPVQESPGSPVGPIGPVAPIKRSGQGANTPYGLFGHTRDGIVI